MIKHKALLVQEGLTYDELTDRIKNKIQRYNSIENSKESKYKMAFGKNKGQLTQTAIRDLNELDEDICELIDEYLVKKEDAEAEFQKQQQKEESEKQEQQKQPELPQQPRNKPFLNWW